MQSVPDITILYVLHHGRMLNDILDGIMAGCWGKGQEKDEGYNRQVFISEKKQLNIGTFGEE